jgi:putative hydrolase of the HAD superfamily
MHQALAKNGVSVPLDEFQKTYFKVRDRYYKETDKTLKEQDFAQRIVDTLKPLGVKLVAQDKRVQQAVAAFMNCFVDSLKIDAYLPQLLEKLHKRYKLAVVSNMSFSKAGIRTLRKFEIDKHFDAVVISGDVGWRKPSPKIFQKALKTLGVKARETVFVGDSPIADVKGAKKLGIKTILYTEKNKQIPATDTFRIYVRESGNAPKPDRTIAELVGLPEALDSLSKEA